MLCSIVESLTGNIKILKLLRKEGEFIHERKEQRIQAEHIIIETRAEYE